MMKGNKHTHTDTHTHTHTHIKRGRRRCRRPQNGQIYLPQNGHFYKTVPKAADLVFAGAVDLQKIDAKIRRLTLLCRRRKRKTNHKIP